MTKIMQALNISFLCILLIQGFTHITGIGCPPSSYGDNCTGRCYCQNRTEMCDKKTGFCKSGCLSGWIGPACDNVDECATRTHSCTKEGQKCENVLASFRCVCRKGYLAIGSHCVRKSQWGRWMIKLGECEERCIQEVTRYRFCVDPPPARRKDKCAGQAVLKTTRVCKRGDCASSMWTKWMRKTTDKCSRSCQRSVTYEKKCIRQVTGIKVPECPGHPERHISEPCTGDDCDECATGQHNCFQVFGMTCIDTQVSFRCVCKQGFSKVPGENKCLPTATWSTWVKTYETDCDVLCYRKVQFKRYCIRPSHLTGTRRCVGGHSQWNFEQCTGGDCKNDKVQRNKNIDKCAARLHNCTKYGQQCENTQQGTVRCTCRQGFTRVKDQCRLKVYWSDWQITYGKCNDSCTRVEKRRRFCQKASELGNDHQSCTGNNEKLTSSSCLGNSCIDGHWTEWTFSNHTECGTSCTRRIYRKRQCINVLNTESGCSGQRESWIEESCSTGSCEKDACMQMANDCYKKEGMECIAKKDSYTCGCTKGYIKVGDNCARNGGWSTWISHTQGHCDRKRCVRLVEFQRYCTNPVPDDHGRLCLGMDIRYNYSKCAHTDCVLAAKTHITKSHSRSFLLLSLLTAGAGLIVAAATQYRSKRLKTTKSTTQIIQKIDEDADFHDNPTFTLAENR